MNTTSKFDPSVQIWVDFGALQEAYTNRTHLRQKVKDHRVDVERARKDVSIFGIYEDCGDAYYGWLDTEITTHRVLTERKVSAERRFKSLKLTFLETYGDQARLIILAHLPGFRPEDIE